MDAIQQTGPGSKAPSVTPPGNDNDKPDESPARLLEQAIAHARNGEMALAREAVDGAINLSPNIAQAYVIRGMLRNHTRQFVEAIADFEKATSLDPAHSALYSAQTEKIIETIRSDAASTDAGVRDTKAGLKGFVRQLANYYAEFLSTDFKKQRLPKRRLQNTDGQGRLTGIPLQKYPGFQQKLWGDLNADVNDGLRITISRGTWRASLPKAVTEAISSHVARISDANMSEAVQSILQWTTGIPRNAVDPEIAYEQFVEKTRATVAKTVVSPFLQQLELFFSRTEQKPVESLKDLEDQLSALLVSGIEESAGAVFSQLLVQGADGELKGFLEEQLRAEIVRTKLQSFFTTFTSADLYVDLTDLVRSSRLLDNCDFYLHVGEVHHGRQVYPMFFMPLRAARTDAGYELSAEPRVYVNKRALDYVAQELAKEEGRGAHASAINERIIYLQPNDRVGSIVQREFDRIAGDFNLRADLDFKAPREQRVSSAKVVATNRLSFSLFDRSDESVVNDYEALVVGADGATGVVEFFDSLIKEFLLENPTSVRTDIERDWEEKPLTEKLIFDSPLPLVEEQRKVLSAIKHPNSRFVAVEGPPGTGKSHTITAVAFDLILSGKNLLILSDKKEALDVVDDKLRQALIKARPSEDFPHPILRLGKEGSNYAQIVRKSSIERLQHNQRYVAKRRVERSEALKSERRELSQAVSSECAAYSSIDVGEIALLEKEKAELQRHDPRTVELFENPLLSQVALDVATLAEFLAGKQGLSSILQAKGARPGQLNHLSHVAQQMSGFVVDLQGFGLSESFSLEHLQSLDEQITKIIDARRVIVGYAFAGKKLRQISRALFDSCGIEITRPERSLAKLEALSVGLRKLHNFLSSRELAASFSTVVQLQSFGITAMAPAGIAPPDVLKSAERLEKVMPRQLLGLSRGRFYSALMTDEGPYHLFRKVGEFKIREATIREQFAAIPKVDYVAAKTKIESLNAQEFAEQIDERLLQFYDNKKADAIALGKIIKEKQRFPVEKFQDIRQAFPCIIASLRDYAEFIPLERDLFDLVIIDEASQVSIAQALPAIIRAKKVLVLGDRNQFGNVKTTNASQEINVAYMNDLFRSFVANYSDSGQSVLTKLDFFNIRRSVLDFIEPLSNYAIQLKKHFRSYPEMISFSSKFFYSDTLQVMKIRGVPVSDVIEFDEVEHDGLLDGRNSNKLEAGRIVERLEGLLSLERPPTVGVITPHTEQQALIAKMAADHPQGEEFHGRLKLKVMTFDSCQGEEREVVFYSLVATEERDRLAYVFPSNLDRDGSAEVDHSLRLQRLNVGFSRAQEKIVFVHSKPIEKYSSSLKTALMHYKGELARARAMPSETQVDAASPMERKVLNWLGQVPFIRDLGETCEIIPQFELGKYLRQLDPRYSHPAYRIDFLIRITEDGRNYQIALEYDGFEFHFQRGVPAGLINSSSWRTYLSPDDLEREKILESFGVPIIRLNRFNLGDDPVATIDRLIRNKIIGLRNREQVHDVITDLIDEVNDAQQGLRDGSRRRCGGCQRDFPIEMFRRASTKTGLGRLCIECRAVS